MDELVKEKSKKECIDYIKSLGFEKVRGVFSHGEAIYYSKKRKVYISFDKDGHRKDRLGRKPKGVWKAADTIENLCSVDSRFGTYDWCLNRVTS